MIADLPQPEERVPLPWICRFSLLNKVSENTEAIELLISEVYDEEIRVPQDLLEARQKILTEYNKIKRKSQISWRYIKVLRRLLV